MQKSSFISKPDNTKAQKNNKFLHLEVETGICY